MSETIEFATLPDATRERYLRYALSVITSRALPDVRDGLKPVQRRILYTMQAVLGLTNDAKHAKSASVVDDKGNFGTINGDPPAAFRYTECRLQVVSSELMELLKEETVTFRPNYD